MGSRQSDVYCRLYDWGVCHQEDRPGAAWRFEVELKGERANSALALLLETDQPQARAAAIVKTTFEDRRIACPVVAGRCRTERAPDIEKTPERLLRWLRTQVRPSVGKLVEAGYLQDVLEALAIPSEVAAQITSQ